MVTFAVSRPFLAGFALVLAGLVSIAHAADPSTRPAAALSEEQKIVHVLNRLGFGPRPRDVERVKEIGLEQYVRQQLDPASIDDAVAEKSIEPLDTLKMSSRHFLGQFYEDVKFFLQMQMSAGNSDEMKMRYGLTMPEKSPTTKPARGFVTASGMPNLQELANRDAIRCINELQHAKLMRAVLSERQLQEVMVDFWSNHFNIDIRKNACRAFLVAHDRDVIRRHALGRFRDLLGGVAHSPAMLAYLDNNENSVVRDRGKVELALIEWYVGYKIGMSIAGQVPRKEGPNENYGRELLELHTLGVDGGYTQQDVQEVARCFTGWTHGPLNGAFDFNGNRHDRGEKVVLGQIVPRGGGTKDGERVLDILAAHPSTARFISRKLATFLVADDPPPPLVERMAQTFLSSDGDIAATLRVMFKSTEFRASLGSKFKDPVHYVMSAVRLAYDDRPILNAQPVIGWLNRMGEGLYNRETPDGYPLTQSGWVSPGQMTTRFEIARAIGSGGAGLFRADGPQGAEVAAFPQLSNALYFQAVHKTLGPATLKGLEQARSPQEWNTFLLSSPEFMNR